MQVFLTTKQLMDDLGLPGDEPGLLNRVLAACTYLVGLMGVWVPVTEERSYVANGDLTLDPVLEIATIEDEDGRAVTDYELRPLNRCWPDGPYRYLMRVTGTITIRGRWGLWDRWTGSALTATQTAGQTTLTIANGAVLWPGQVIMVGDELQTVTGANGGVDSPDPSAAVSLLAGAVDEADEQITVDDGSEFFPGEVLRLDFEDVLIRRKGGNVLLVTRGWNGTSRSVHADNSPLYVYRTVAVERAANGTRAVAHSEAAISLYAPPDDVNYLGRQIAALMRSKAQTGYSGRAGNADQGEAFWINEYPQRQIDAVRYNYAL